MKETEWKWINEKEKEIRNFWSRNELIFQNNPESAVKQIEVNGGGNHYIIYLHSMNKQI